MSDTLTLRLTEIANILGAENDEQGAILRVIADLKTEIDGISAIRARIFDGSQPAVSGSLVEFVQWLDDNLVLAREDADVARHVAADVVGEGALRRWEEALRAQQSAERHLQEVIVERDALKGDVLRLTETARAASENWMSACEQRDEARRRIADVEILLSREIAWRSRYEFGSHPACECHQEQGDSACRVHGLEDSNGWIFVPCTHCDRRVDATDPKGGHGWRLRIDGWHCTDHLTAEAKSR